jgi:2-oxoglutarate dehydrogenase E2 component (dihydrolipoamide succinyltransferase)
MSEAETTIVVPMPHMGVSVEEGTVIEWLVAVGDEVGTGQSICAIATDKVDTEIEAPADGVLAKILVEVDENVAVGAPLAVLETAGGAGEGSPDAPPRGEAAASEEDGGALRSVSGDPSPAPLSDLRSTNRGGLAERAAAGRDAFGRFDPKAAAGAVLSFVGSGPQAAMPASPVARRMAASNGIDLGAVQGSGRGGRIRKADVEQAITRGDSRSVEFVNQEVTNSTLPGPQLGADGLPIGYEGVPHEVIKTSRVRQVIAERMVRSRQTAAHMTTEVDVDLSATVRARAELNGERVPQGLPKLSYLPFIARAACVALGEHPELNATFLGERTIHWQAVNLGIAVDTPEGLLVPVIKGCEQLTVPGIGEAIADLAERARTRKLVPDDLAGGTFTLSNPGSVGAVSAPAIINQPQVAILGVPTIQRRPWVTADEQGNEAIAVRPILRLSVTFDHRAVDGADATRFAVSVKDHLEAWGAESGPARS